MNTPTAELTIEGTAIAFDRPGAGLPIICAGGAVEPIVPSFPRLKEWHRSDASGEVVQQQRPPPRAGVAP
jgi:hypothetical protein